ncbi:hypothetical protein CHUAL_012723 [Chamberlinius hualienensis]
MAEKNAEYETEVPRRRKVSATKAIKQLCKDFSETIVGQFSFMTVVMEPSDGYYGAEGPRRQIERRYSSSYAS